MDYICPLRNSLKGSLAVMISFSSRKSFTLSSSVFSSKSDCSSEMNWYKKSWLEQGSIYYDLYLTWNSVASTHSLPSKILLFGSKIITKKEKIWELSRSLKVSKSQKQFMVKWILQKNEHWISALEDYYFKFNTKRQSMFFLQEDRLSFVLPLE